MLTASTFSSNVVILSHCFEVDGKEMYQNVRGTCRACNTCNKSNNDNDNDNDYDDTDILCRIKIYLYIPATSHLSAMLATKTYNNSFLKRFLHSYFSKLSSENTWTTSDQRNHKSSHLFERHGGAQLKRALCVQSQFFSGL